MGIHSLRREKRVPCEEGGGGKNERLGTYKGTGEKVNRLGIMESKSPTIREGSYKYRKRQNEILAL